jgi:hypothetical protein
MTTFDDQNNPEYSVKNKKPLTWASATLSLILACHGLSAQATEQSGRELALCSGILFNVARNYGDASLMEKSQRAYIFPELEGFKIPNSERENLYESGQRMNSATARNSAQKCLALLAQSEKELKSANDAFFAIGETGEWYKYDDAIYEGQKLKGLPHGKGRLVSKRGAIDYTGEFKNGKADGDGNMAGRFSGKFKNGDFTGVGTAFMGTHGKVVRTAEDVKGYSPDDWAATPGTFHFPNGDTWHGKHKNNWPEGEGILKKVDGTEEVAAYRHGDRIQKAPTATKTAPQNNANASNTTTGTIRTEQYEYTGELKNNSPHGKGVMTSPNGSKYDGEFINGKFNGKGVFYYTNGTVYDGQWKNHERTQGTLTLVNKIKLTGDFSNSTNGKLNGTFLAEFPSGKKEKATFSDSKKISVEPVAEF